MVATAPGTGDADPPSTTAIVVVARSIDPTEGSRAEASARFVRVAGSSTASALQSIGASLDLPRDSCASVASLASAAGPGEPGERALIELADVGSVSIDTGETQARLAPRQLPDVTDVVSGVVYARAADPAAFPAGVAYTLRVSGAADIDPIETRATAPADPTDVRLVGEDVLGAADLPAGEPLEFAWPAGSVGPGDSLYADIRPSGGTGVRCVLASDDIGDGGLSSAVIPSTLLADEHGAFTEGTVVVHRVHREAFRARGLEGGEVRFDFARTIAYKR